jgi:solute carrier family 45, member 1/2/4
MSAIGNLIGYGIGTIDMVNLFGTRFGDTQFKQMTVVAALSLITAVSITSYAVQERVLISRR